MLIAAGATVVGAGATGAWYVLGGPGRTAVVPGIEGMTQEEAQAAVEAVGLAWGAPTRAYSDTVEAGLVISCDPAVGRRVKLGAAVTATISQGVEQKEVPDVVGMTQEEATAAITGAGLTLGAVTQEYSADVAEGEVVSSTPKAGQTVNHSSAVAIVVSKGRQPATVPDVTGMTVADATTTLEAAGLRTGTTTEAFSDSVEDGRVISSDPAARASGYFYGDGVNLVVSKGPEKVTVPDVSGMSQAEATSTLRAAGLSVSVSTILGGLFGTVHSTDPAAGTSVRKGSTVTLYVV